MKPPKPTHQEILSYLATHSVGEAARHWQVEGRTIRNWRAGKGVRQVAETEWYGPIPSRQFPLGTPEVSNPTYRKWADVERAETGAFSIEDTPYSPPLAPTLPTVPIDPDWMVRHEQPSGRRSVARHSDLSREPKTLPELLFYGLLTLALVAWVGYIVWGFVVSNASVIFGGG
jgi:hypothetical protein